MFEMVQQKRYLKLHFQQIGIDECRDVDDFFNKWIWIDAFGKRNWFWRCFLMSAQPIFMMTLKWANACLFGFNRMRIMTRITVKEHTYYIVQDHTGTWKSFIITYNEIGAKQRYTLNTENDKWKCVWRRYRYPVSFKP